MKDWHVSARPFVCSPGNVTLLGAASNLIIGEQAEKEEEEIGFGEFLTLGVPLSLSCLTVFILTFVPYAR